MPITKPHCPVCQQPMKRVRSGVTANRGGGKYDHTMYQCETDDTWVVYEIHIEGPNSQVPSGAPISEA